MRVITRMKKRLSSWSSSDSGKPILMCPVQDVGLCTNVKFLMLRFDWRASNQSNYTITSCSWANRVRQNAWDWLQAISFLPTHSPFSFSPPHVSQFLTHLRRHACLISPPGKGNETVATQAKLQKRRQLKLLYHKTWWETLLSPEPPC